MKPNSSSSLLGFASIVLLFLATACQQTSAGNPSTPVSEASAPTQPAASSKVEAASEEVTYEPAYPEDVSAEGLDADDAAQQETHSHGGAEHSHDDGGDHGGAHDH